MVTYQRPRWVFWTISMVIICASGLLIYSCRRVVEQDCADRGGVYRWTSGGWGRDGFCFTPDGRVMLP